MALLNHKQGGGFSTTSPVTVVPAVASGNRFAITSIVVHNQHTSDVAITIEVYDGTNSVIFVDESILSKESYYYDMKIVLTDGESLRVTTNNANVHVIVSGDDA